jgi:quercetin dioxygenase-like cupin family protein
MNNPEQNNQTPMLTWKNHPKFEGVMISDVEVVNVPSHIMEALAKIDGAAVTTVTAVKAKEIPMHTHTDDGEIYYNDTAYATIKVAKPDGEVELHAGEYDVTMPGESHGIINDREDVFYGLKFVVNN